MVERSIPWSAASAFARGEAMKRVSWLYSWCGGCWTGSRRLACLRSATDRWRGSDLVGQCRGNILIRSADDADQRSGHHGCAVLHQDLAQDAGGEGLEIHDGLVGFDFSERLPCLHLVPFAFFPRKEDALFHRVGQFWHDDATSHEIPSRMLKKSRFSRTRRARRALSHAPFSVDTMRQRSCEATPPVVSSLRPRPGRGASWHASG